MSSGPTDIAALKSRLRDTWMAGDFGQIARFTAGMAEEFVARLKIASGMSVLDVACGTGNTAIPEARAGARVTGVDIATNLLEQAGARAAKQGVEIDFREGDAEQLAFPDASFDAVITVFGAMFAPRPHMVAAELLRVCRPGGMIAMANWTPSGFVGQMFKLTAQYVPPPANVPPPVLWGDEATVKERLGAGVKEIRLTRQMSDFDTPHPPAKVVEIFRQYFGPTQMAFARLDHDRQAAYAADLVDLWKRHNQRTDGGTFVSGEYLEVIAVRK
jgi:SAM-dependent methyltransferase